MESTKALLQNTYETTRLGAETISAILPKTQDPDVRKTLINTLSQYDDLSQKTAEELIRLGNRAKDHPLAEMAASFAVHVAASDSPQTKEITRLCADSLLELVKKEEEEIKKYPDASPAASILAGECLRLTRSTREEMMGF